MASSPSSTAQKSVVRTQDAPSAIGPYSQAVVLHDMVYTSGQIPLDPATMEIVGGGIADQMEQVCLNLRAVLAAAGSRLEDVVKTTVFMTDLGQFAAMNEVYARYFNPEGTVAPARSTVQVAALPRGVAVEIECVALRRG